LLFGVIEMAVTWGGDGLRFASYTELWIICKFGKERYSSLCLKTAFDEIVQ
jgi:hypothetical protein